MTRDHLRGAVHGTNYQVVRDISNIPSGETVTRAWFTVKRKLIDADPGAMQKTINTTDVVGQGQVTNPADTQASVRFDITGSDWDRVVPGNMYQFDIQIRTSGGYIFQAVAGTFVADPRVTQATA